MQVARWGNSLAVRIPASVVQALKLQEGDELVVRIAPDGAFEVTRPPHPRKFWRAFAGCGGVARRFPFSREDAMSEADPANGTESAFLDTNVLIYLLSDNTHKADIAQDLLRSGGVVSVQVLNEFASVALRKTDLRPTRCERCWPEYADFAGGTVDDRYARTGARLQRPLSVLHIRFNDPGGRDTGRLHHADERRPARRPDDRKRNPDPQPVRGRSLRA